MEIHGVNCGCFEECVKDEAMHLSTMTIDEVKTEYFRGNLTKPAHDAYCHIWAINRDYSPKEWKEFPKDKATQEIAKELSAILSSGRGYQ